MKIVVEPRLAPEDCRIPSRASGCRASTDSTRASNSDPSEARAGRTGFARISAGYSPGAVRRRVANSVHPRVGRSACAPAIRTPHSAAFVNRRQAVGGERRLDDWPPGRTSAGPVERPSRPGSSQTAGNQEERGAGGDNTIPATSGFAPTRVPRDLNGTSTDCRMAPGGTTRADRRRRWPCVKLGVLVRSGVCERRHFVRADVDEPRQRCAASRRGRSEGDRSSRRPASRHRRRAGEMAIAVRRIDEARSTLIVPTPAVYQQSDVGVTSWAVRPPHRRLPTTIRAFWIKLSVCTLVTSA